MKPLAAEFKKGEFDHKLVKREGDFAIYWRKAPHHRDAHYEVIVVQHQPARTFPNGETVEEREGYPSSEQWGKYGWTYNSLPAAELKLKLLQEAAQKVST